MSLALVSALICSSSALYADPLTISSPYVKGAKTTWRVRAHVDATGQHVEANFLHQLVIKSVENGKVSGVFSWDELRVDDRDMGSVGEWETVLNSDGTVNKMVSAEDDYRRMLLVFNVPVPYDKPLEVGSKWEVTGATDIKTAAKVSYTGEVVAAETVNAVQTLKLKVKIVEVGDNMIMVDGLWWVGKDGVIQKFTVNVTNWLVPLAGSDTINAKLEGELKKP